MIRQKNCEEIHFPYMSGITKHLYFYSPAIAFESIAFVIHPVCSSTLIAIVLFLKTLFSTSKSLISFSNKPNEAVLNYSKKYFHTSYVLRKHNGKTSAIVLKKFFTIHVIVRKHKVQTISQVIPAYVFTQLRYNQKTLR